MNRQACWERLKAALEAHTQAMDTGGSRELIDLLSNEVRKWERLLAEAESSCRGSK